MPGAARQWAVLVVLGPPREEDRGALFFCVQTLVHIIRTRVIIVIVLVQLRGDGVRGRHSYGNLEIFWDVGWIQFLILDAFLSLLG